MSTDPGPLPEDAIESRRIESGVIPTGDALADHHSAHGAAPRRVLKVHWFWLRNWQPPKRNPRPWPDDMEEWLTGFAPSRRDGEGPTR